VNNPKTTILGYIILLGAVCQAIAEFMQHGVVNLQPVIAAVGGVGLIAAKDGGH
jgi:hypothetical protein